MTDKEQLERVARAMLKALETAPLRDMTHGQVIRLQAQAAIDAMQPKWLPIETAPRDGTEILITDGFDVCTARYKKWHVANYAPFFATTANGETFNTGYDWQLEPQFIPATHWMPLPTPPERKQ